MLRGLYITASSLAAQLKKNDLTANNLANVNTAGFKKQEALSQSFQKTLLERIDYRRDSQASPRIPIGSLGKGVSIDEIFTYYNQGTLSETQGQLDIALEGQGYFVVSDQEGNELYTRNGSLTINSEGFLSTQTGHLVQGTSGPILITGTIIDINETGEIYIDGVLQDRLQVVNIENPRQLGDSMFRGENPVSSLNTKVKQGYLERANVNSIEEMTKLINATRAYESNQKIMQAYDNTLDKLINEAGRI